jgi:phosphatidylinositol N-acetylglucosaminyltransferase subunit Q
MRKLRILKPIDYSATFSQLMFRKRVIHSWVESLQRLRDGSGTDLDRKKILFSLLTSMGVVIVDLLVGGVCAWLLFYRPEVFFVPIQRAYVYLNNEILQSVVAWLMDSPAGLQMNRNMVVFIGTISLTVVTYWDALVSFCMTSSGSVDVDSMISTFLALISLLFGVSTLMSVLIDLASFVFFHIFFLCLGTSRLWNATVQITVSFTHFFQGRKYNVLKHRVDNHEFTIDQLILGTVFLSMVMFLMPTVLVFYITYVLLWSGVVLLQLIMRSLVSVFSYFPFALFAFRHRIPFSRKINRLSPGGGRRRQNSSEGLSHGIVSVPLSIRDILEEFVRCVATSFFPATHNYISKTAAGLVKGTAIIFPKYVHHDLVTLDFGYNRLFRRMQ